MLCLVMGGVETTGAREMPSHGVVKVGLQRDSLNGAPLPPCPSMIDVI